ncbi:hypothetical protein C8Q74DRAFT_1273751 [Fomes fomentarius]|nr:hypothetical protein C8Q74DRAFT_1273751 [Fomes fomentarius]
MEDTSVAIGKAAKSPMQNNFCDCGLYVLAFVEAFMRDPIVSSEAIRRSSMDWYTNTTLDLREAWRKRTLELCEQWKKERAAKEGAKDEPSGSKEKDTESAKAKPIPEVIEDSGDDLEISEVVPPSKTSNRGGKKGAVGKANRLR